MSKRSRRMRHVPPKPVRETPDKLVARMRELGFSDGEIMEELIRRQGGRERLEQ